jgi:hypothetical protein
MQHGLESFGTAITYIQVESSDRQDMFLGEFIDIPVYIYRKISANHAVYCRVTFLTNSFI